MRRIVLTGALVVLAAACSTGEAAAPPVETGTIGGVGTLPLDLSDTVPARPGGPTTTVDDSDPAATIGTEPDPTGPTTTLERIPFGDSDVMFDPLGIGADGNRVIIIGDSITASTARRYGGQMCAELVPLGWAVEVDAETGRFIDFADRVLDARWSAGWDVVVIFLGNNYGSNPDVFEQALRTQVDRVAPTPTLLYTVTEFRADRKQVNAIVREIDAEYDHVHVVEWARITADDRSLLGDDGLHLSDRGRSALAQATGLALGAAAPGSIGKCLSTQFTDDRAGTGVNGRGSGSSGGGSGGGSSGNRTTTTVKPSGTTAPPTTGGGTAPPTTSGSTPPPTTSGGTPPPTTSGNTNPPPTNPPPTT
jgi:hypothetical protein